MTVLELRRWLQRLVRKLIPAPIRDKAKTVIGALGLVVQAINLTVPDYGDEAKAIVGVIVGVATLLGLYEIPNVPVDRVGERPRGSRHQRQRA